MLNRQIFSSAVVFVALLLSQSVVYAAPESDEPSPRLADWVSNHQAAANTPSTPESPAMPETDGIPPAAPAAPEIDRLHRLGEKLAADPSVSSGNQTRAANADSPILPAATSSAAPSEPPATIEADSRPILMSGDSTDASPISPKTARGDESSSWLLNTLTALGIVIGLIFLLKKMINKMSGTVAARTNRSVVELLSRTSVAPRNHVLVLKVGQRVLIVGDSSQGLRTLSEITDPNEIADILTHVEASKPTSVTRSFNQLFNRFDGDYEQDQWQEEGADHSEYAVDRARDSVSSLLSKVKAMSSRGGHG